MAEHRLAQALVPDEDDVLAFADEVEREDPVDRRAVELLGPVPFEIGERLEAAEARVAQAPFEPPPRPVVLFGLDERFEQDDRAPAFLRGARDQIVEVLGGVGQAEPLQVIGQGRRRRRIG